MADSPNIGLPPEVNVIDPGNSTSTPLGPSGTFAGQFTEVVGFTSLTVLLFADQIVSSAVLQWSSDGVNVDDEQEFFGGFWPGSFGQGVVVHSTVRARYVRVRVVNGGTAQTSFRVQSLLRKGVPIGYVSPLSMFPADADDAQTVKAVLYGRRPSGSPTYTQIAVDGNGKLQVVRPPNPTANTRTLVNASLASQRLDIGLFGPNRKHFYVFNDTNKGVLHIRLGGAAALDDFDFKVRPQEPWQLPHDWYIWGGAVHGVWDKEDGVARCSEIV